MTKTNEAITTNETPDRWEAFPAVEREIAQNLHHVTWSMEPPGLGTVIELGTPELHDAEKSEAAVLSFLEWVRDGQPSPPDKHVITFSPDSPRGERLMAAIVSKAEEMGDPLALNHAALSALEKGLGIE